jgi:predicted Fe-S protein YdhL (DUF1289 family)
MKNSPCIGQCYDVDMKKEQCLACFRTFDEIATWWDMSPEETTEKLKELKKRRKKGRKGGNPAG